ncbi:hypothetical protein B0A50_08070 [Salinomyces thailandicus]|uniref:non-specific serine/threonine protein kinase n=1 Tax=Salinomyces thailandicus TaxID=706561 RepID=A0A4U0TKV7_9PEZI|nr:hypothetical protein B0A50_08070 [Salinomyces thailandica]
MAVRGPRGSQSQPWNEEATQQNTQGAMDPRRLGRNNSGLSEADISDVMCILHPCSPAAFRIVATTAEISPFNVLQNNGYGDYDDGLTRSALEEQETFILNNEGGASQAMDLALRFSADTINPTLGFVFGRNVRICDIVLATDNLKRVSNMHFSIFMNESGVLMLRDMSTNGTMVDDMLLKGKNSYEPQTRMLSPGSVIQILSVNLDEVVKFIVRIPSREGHFEEYEEKFQQHMERMAIAEAKMARGGEHARTLAPPNPRTQNAGSYKAPLVQNQHGMQWTGGDRYNVVGLIGKGAFATVFQLATKAEGHLVAAKELEKRRFMKNGVLDRKLDNELQIMKEISHPNIVRYVDYHDHTNHLYIIMEFVPCGDLQQYLNLHGPLVEGLGRKMAAQVLDSLCYLHTKKITHRDIKPDNILLADLRPDHFTIKLSDFGLSKVVKDNDTFLKTFCGTLLYCAPEVFPHYDAHTVAAGRGQKRPRKTGAIAPAAKFHSYSQSVDVWSFGAVLWFSLCNRPPFEGVADNTGRGMFEKIMMTPLDSTDLISENVSDEAVSLLCEMLNTNPAARPSPAACLKHPWFGNVRQPTVADDEEPASPELVLQRIEEEEEDMDANGGAQQAPDLSQLSIQGQAYVQLDSGDSQDSHYDEASLHSGSMNFFDPRQSKRFKSEAFAYRQQGQSLAESSSEVLGQRKLFGEISASALNAVKHGTQGPEISRSKSAGSDSANSSHSSNPGSQLARGEAALGAVASPSLLGAESLMREVHMQSPENTDSPAAEMHAPTTPHTPDQSRPFSAGQPLATPRLKDDVTPKQIAPRAFNRQIEIPIPASFWFDPNDESTHTLEYASKVSGQDYLANRSDVVTKSTSLATTMSGNVMNQGSRNQSQQARESQHHSPPEERNGDTDVELEPSVSHPSDTKFIKPPPRLGRLVSTPDSFIQTTLNFSERINSWGRDPSNTHVHPEKGDTRIAKRSIVLWFHAPGIDKLPSNVDWTKLPGLHCGVHTESSSGIYVNGVPLKKSISSGGELHWGKVYSGDEIEVWRDPRQGNAGLKFRLEVFHGEGRERRPVGAKAFEIVHGVVQKAPQKSEKRDAKGRDVVSSGKLAVV